MDWKKVFTISIEGALLGMAFNTVAAVFQTWGGLPIAGISFFTLGVLFSSFPMVLVGALIGGYVLMYLAKLVAKRIPGGAQVSGV